MSGSTHMPTGSSGQTRRSQRGHMRSGNWSQLPASIMTPTVEKDEHELLEPVERTAMGSDHHHETEHVHTHSHSHSHSHNIHNPNYDPNSVSNHSHSHSHNNSYGHGHSHSISGVGVKVSDESTQSGIKASDAYSTPFQGSDKIPLRLVKPLLSCSHIR